MSETLYQEVFKFKQFDIIQDDVPMKVNTDAIMLGSWSDASNCRNALDIGSGTGIIAMMIAQRFENMEVVGIDVDEVSAQISAMNFANCPFQGRLKSHSISVQEFATRGIVFDKIVSNPPFFSGGTFSFNENKTNVRHTVKLSHTDLLASVQRLLTPGGSFDVVLPYIEGLRFIEIAKQYDLNPLRITEVRSRISKSIERLLMSLTNSHNATAVQDELIIYDGDQGANYSEGYLRLTKDFYLFIKD